MNLEGISKTRKTRNKMKTATVQEEDPDNEIDEKETTRNPNNIINTKEQQKLPQKQKGKKQEEKLFK